MSDNNDNNDKAGEFTANIARFLQEWPVLDVLDFEGVAIDVTQWEEDEFTATLNFHMPGEEPPFSGYSLCTQIGGSNLQEVWEKIELLLASGLLDGTDIASSGIIWNADGDEIGTVDWTEYTDYYDSDEGDGENAEPTDTDVSSDRVLH